MKASFKLEIVCGRKLLYPTCETAQKLVKLVGHSYAKREGRAVAMPAAHLPLLKSIGFELDISGDQAIVNMLTY